PAGPRRLRRDRPRRQRRRAETGRYSRRLRLPAGIRRCRLMTALARNQVFSAVHTVGALLPADMLLRIAEGKDVKGSQPGDYGVIGARSVRDEAERHWDYLRSVWSELRATLPAAP